MIHLAQYLCPARHCLIGMAYESSEYTPDEIEIMLTAAAVRLRMNGFCGVCGSKDLHYEHGATKYETMKDAEPELTRLQAENLASRAAIQEIRKRAKNN